jgi:hypothetical protein
MVFCLFHAFGESSDNLTGLSLISAYPLDQGPEEDAFWTCASVVDMHLRDYLSANPPRLEMDAALFSKALESNDLPLVNKLFV